VCSQTPSKTHLISQSPKSTGYQELARSPHFEVLQNLEKQQKTETTQQVTLKRIVLLKNGKIG
jgi:hypothetical protein